MADITITSRLDVPEERVESAKDEVQRALEGIAQRHGGRVREVYGRVDAWGRPAEEITGESRGVERAAANREIREWEELPDDL